MRTPTIRPIDKLGYNLYQRGGLWVVLSPKRDEYLVDPVAGTCTCVYYEAHGWRERSCKHIQLTKKVLDIGRERA